MSKEVNMGKKGNNIKGMGLKSKNSIEGMGLGERKLTVVKQKGIAKKIKRHVLMNKDTRVLVYIEDGRIVVKDVTGVEVVASEEVIGIKKIGNRDGFVIDIKEMISPSGNVTEKAIMETIKRKMRIRKEKLKEIEEKELRKKKKEDRDKQQARELYKHHQRAINGLTGQSKKNPKKSKKGIQKEEYELDL